MRTNLTSEQILEILNSIPEPVREPLNKETVYYVPELYTFDTTSSLFYTITWIGDDVDNNHLLKGIIHLTPQYADLHAKALLKLTTIHV